MADMNENQVEEIFKNAAAIFLPAAGKRLKLMRMELKLDQSQLAKALGVGARTITGAENGARVQRNPIIISRLIDVFGIRRVLYILMGRYAASIESKANSIHTEYWKLKHAKQGNPSPYYSKDFPRYRDRSKDELLQENIRLMEEVNKMKKGSNSGKT